MKTPIVASIVNSYEYEFAEVMLGSYGTLSHLTFLFRKVWMATVTSRTKELSVDRLDIALVLLISP